VNIITVKINGMEYNLKAEENDAYLHMVARYVDKKISILMDNNSKISRPDATILAALNLGDEAFKSREAYERINENYKTLLNEQKNLISEIERLKNTLEQITTENKDLKVNINNLKGEQGEELKIRLEKVNEEMNEMEAVAKEIKAENEKLVNENEKLILVNKQLFSEKRKLRDESCDKTRKIKELAIELQIKNKEIVHEKLKNNPLIKVNA
jgi:cell division protein ZapA